MTNILLINESVAEITEIKVSNYCLKWRQNHLFVEYTDKPEQLALFAIDSQEVLVNCLKVSPVRLVCLDPGIGATQIKFWADACVKAGKPVYLRGSHQANTLNWSFKQMSAGGFALLISLVLNPIILALMALMSSQSAEQMFIRQWHIGNKGRLFHFWKFRTNCQLFNALVNKASLDELSSLSKI